MKRRRRRGKAIWKKSPFIHTMTMYAADYPVHFNAMIDTYMLGLERYDMGAWVCSCGVMVPSNLRYDQECPECLGFKDAYATRPRVSINN